MKLPENDTVPADELVDATEAIFAFHGKTERGARNPPVLALALALDRAMRAYELAHPIAPKAGRPSKSADLRAIPFLAERTGFDARYIRRLVGFVKAIQHELLLCLRSFRHGVTVSFLAEVARMPAEDQAELAEHLRGVPPNSNAAAEAKTWRRTREAGSTNIADDEIGFMNALMIGLQRAYKERIFVERRNVGTVVTRDRSGRRTGVFHASKVVGAADISGALAPHGQRFEIETKMADGALSDEQCVFRDRMLQLGVLYLVDTYDDGMDLDANVARAVAKFDALVNGVVNVDQRAAGVA